MRPITFARRIPGAPEFLPTERNYEASDHLTASQLTSPQLPSTPERSLIRLVVESGLHALTMPTTTGIRRKDQQSALRLNAIAWIMGHIQKPRFAFDYCCWVLGNDTEAAQKALIVQHNITEDEIRRSRAAWVWKVFTDHDGRAA